MYPKNIELKDDKLKSLLEAKGELITKGRAVSEEIEKLEKEMAEIDAQLVEAEKEIDISDIDANAQDITNRFNALKEEMDEVNRRVRERLVSKVPRKLRNDYDEKATKKKELEEERNKIALKAQKHNDKIIPIVKKLLKPYLTNEFEDFGSVKVEDGVVKGEIYSHLEEFKKSFLAKNKKG